MDKLPLRQTVIASTFFAAARTEVQMPPAPLDGVVYSTQSFTVRTLKMFSRHMLQAQFQAFGFSLEAALGHSPLR
jgi:hypothetical protein